MPTGYRRRPAGVSEPKRPAEPFLHNNEASWILYNAARSSLIGMNPGFTKLLIIYVIFNTFIFVSDQSWGRMALARDRFRHRSTPGLVWKERTGRTSKNPHCSPGSKLNRPKTPDAESASVRCRAGIVIDRDLSLTQKKPASLTDQDQVRSRRKTILSRFREHRLESDVV